MKGLHTAHDYCTPSVYVNVVSAKLRMGQWDH